MNNQKETRPLYFYVANLGSEVQRIFSLKEKGDIKAMKNAYERAVLIIEKIKSFGNKDANLEISILSDSLGKIVNENAEIELNRDQISSYFNPFALRVVNSLV